MRRTEMKLNTARTLFGIFFLAAFVSLAPAAQAHGCTMSEVAGEYGYTSSGSIVTPAVGAFTAVGTLAGAQTANIAAIF
jgi:hypothetical protein